MSDRYSRLKEFTVCYRLQCEEVNPVYQIPTLLVYSLPLSSLNFSAALRRRQLL